MSNSLKGRVVALMVAAGFIEYEFAELQRTLIKSGATLKTIAAETGLTNGWDATAGTWGHYHPVDAQLSTVLAADLDALIIIDGTRSITKLKTNLNTPRILRHMLDAEKAVAVCGSAGELIAALNRTGDEPWILRVDTSTTDWADGVLKHIAQHSITDDVKAAA